MKRRLAVIYLLLRLLLHAHSFLFPIVDRHNQRFHRTTLSSCKDYVENPSDSIFDSVKSDSSFVSPHRQTEKFLIHWRGEGVDGYSMQFRHLEFQGALAAICGVERDRVSFEDALNYNGKAEMPLFKLEQYQSGMQYLHVPDAISEQSLVHASQRCSLINSLYKIVAMVEQDGSYSDLAETVIQNGGLSDMYRGGPNERVTWKLRARYYGAHENPDKERRYSSRSRSMKLERDALKAFEPLLLEFGGKVCLENPECTITIFDGLSKGKILGRRVAGGPRTSILNPNTRICVTNTPLNPMAAFCLNNVAQLQPNSTVLDPYCGSAATLLAASMIDPSCRTVGIEIAHNGIVNRDDIRRDFESRSLPLPAALIYGDSTDVAVLGKARAAIGHEPFDVIVADPPYGIRESSNYNELTPAEELFHSLRSERESGRRLLKLGGRLVVFVPVNEDETITKMLPTLKQTIEAGLELEVRQEQPLNDVLSRWLVSYRCVQ